MHTELRGGWFQPQMHVVRHDFHFYEFCRMLRIDAEISSLSRRSTSPTRTFLLYLGAPDYIVLAKTHHILVCLKAGVHVCVMQRMLL